ncbi:MAG: hypothetical protein Q8R79_06250 [Legionellaceae bacterium]|nr:hypothetical protein [Legionellaceae bacterium]
MSIMSITGWGFDVRTEQVDIYTYPTSQDTDAAQCVFTLGDLHGNAMKLLFVLIRWGIVSGVTPKAYQTLANIYQKEVQQLSAEDLRLFAQLIDDAQGVSGAFLRLLGDDMADRGQNDYFTMQILQKLKRAGVHTEIILSNHGYEFVALCERAQSSISKETFLSHFREVHCAPITSLNNLRVLIEKDRVLPEDVLTFYEDVYKPMLAINGGTLSDDQQKIVLYTHAPVDLRYFMALAKKLDIRAGEVQNARALAQMLMKIQQKFQRKYLQNNRGHCLFEETATPDIETTPVNYGLWNRQTVNLALPDYAYLIHGHTSDTLSAHSINLDNNLGKSMALNQGILTYVVQRR